MAAEPTRLIVRLEPARSMAWCTHHLYPIQVDLEDDDGHGNVYGDCPKCPRRFVSPTIGIDPPKLD